ncbi:MAG TPA: hypothetical protein VGG10_02400 [Rhizomicrobium sp.]|jgi:hypothetical protein
MTPRCARAERAVGSFVGFGPGDVLDFSGVNFGTAHVSLSYDTVHSAGVTVTLTDATHSQSMEDAQLLLASAVEVPVRSGGQ